LFNNFEWFSGDFTLDDPSQKSINVSLSYFKSDSLLIVLGYAERLEGRTVKGLLWCIVPVPSFCSYCFFCHGKVFLCYCLIVTKRREFMRKELSPLTCRNHVIYDTTTEGFVFGGGVGAVEDAVVYVMHIHTSKTIL
jgi:hypothetical protein